MTQALNELTQPSQKVLNIGATQSAPVLSGISQPVTIFPESHVNTSNAAQSTLQVQKSHLFSQRISQNPPPSWAHEVEVVLEGCWFNSRKQE